MHLACLQGSSETIEFLLRQKLISDINAKNIVIPLIRCDA